ncbi:MAG: NAD-dependent epimerase/dehydratase family protein [Deltaproteobacteria bacterium]|nr:NAD-dependent epimerase/dehydratase family protein [Deltaproteobacteria bacterium]
MHTVLVTGGEGFIGSTITSQLIEKGYRVRVADNISKGPNHAGKREQYEFLNVDLTNPQATKKVFEDVDYCIHLAAKIGGIGYFHKYPATILSENNKINSSVFEAAAQHKIQRLVYISSSMVFERSDRFPSNEADLKIIPPPKTAYGFSKLIGEWYCRAFFEEFGLKYNICRLFNAYGKNEWPGEEVGYAHVIPDMIKKILSGDYPLTLLGDGEQTRCFTHVEDVAKGVIAVMENEKGINEDFNVGSSDEIKMINLAKKIWDLCGIKAPFQARFVEGLEHDIKRRVPNCQKVEKMIGWKPRIKLDQGLHEVVTWLKKELEHIQN